MKERLSENNSGYFVVRGSEIEFLSKRETVKLRDVGLWSIRLSTGLLGKMDCLSGNRGSKDINEVMAVVGEEGLKQVLRWGFIPCPSCRPEKSEVAAVWIREVVSEKYGLSLDEFVDKDLVGFDPSRINCEEIVKQTGVVPGRLYLSNE